MKVVNKIAGKITGLTIEINGKTDKLTKALKDVNESSKDVTKELNQIQKSLNFNPGNTDLLEQQQRSLSKQIENTKEKLDVLKEAHKQAEQQLANGDLGQEDFDALTREILKTENQLERYAKQLQASKQESEKFESANKDLKTLFDATGTSVDDFADVLGTKLTKAIKDGKADSGSLEEAIEKIGKASLGAEVDIDKLRNTLKQVDDGAGIDKVKLDLQQLEKEAKGSQGAIEELRENLVNLAGSAGVSEAIEGLSAGIENAADKLQGVVEKALEQGSTNAKIDVTMDLDEKSTEAVKASLRTVEAYGIDAGEALNGVRKQFQLNSDASDEANAKLVEQAGAVASAYDAIDFTELIQETNEIGSTLNISNEKALGLVNSLLKVGFPPDQLDIISEYGAQLSEAGYSAEEIQAIMAAGIETGTWNIDNLLDGLKEGRIKLAEFGSEVPKATQELLKSTDISTKQLQDWGKAVAEGGEGGKKAMQEVASALVGVDDATTRNALGVQIFGTIWEDQGTNITDTLLGVNDNLKTTAQNEEDLTKTTEGMQDANYNWNQALLTLQSSLAPLLEVVADVVTKVSEWVKENPGLTTAILAVVGVVTTLLPIIASLGLLFSSLSVAAGVLGISVGAVIAPVLAVIGIIAALVAGGIALFLNWDTIKEKAGELGKSVSEKWESIKTATAEKWDSVKKSVGDSIDSAKEKVTTKVGEIKNDISTKWEEVKTSTSDKWSNIKDTINTKLDEAKTSIADKTSNMRSTIATKWDEVKTSTDDKWLGIKNTITDKIGGAKDAVAGKAGEINNAINEKFGGAFTTAKSKFGDIKTEISDKINGAKEAVREAINKIKGFFDFNWSLPKITLPHFSMTGKFSLNPPQIPSFGVKWYKEGGIFESPSIIGVGEAGREAVLPIDKIDDIMAKALKKAGTIGTVNHTGTIRVEGVSNKNELMGVVDIILDEIRREVRS